MRLGDKFSNRDGLQVSPSGGWHGMRNWKKLERFNSSNKTGNLNMFAKQMVDTSLSVGIRYNNVQRCGVPESPSLSLQANVCLSNLQLIPTLIFIYYNYLKCIPLECIKKTCLDCWRFVLGILRMVSLTFSSSPVLGPRALLCYFLQSHSSSSSKSP